MDDCLQLRTSFYSCFKTKANLLPSIQYCGRIYSWLFIFCSFVCPFKISRQQCLQCILSHNLWAFLQGHPNARPKRCRGWYFGLSATYLTVIISKTASRSILLTDRFLCLQQRKLSKSVSLRAIVIQAPHGAKYICVFSLSFKHSELMVGVNSCWCTVTVSTVRLGTLH